MKNKLIILLSLPLITLATMGTASAGYNCGYNQPQSYYNCCCKCPSPVKPRPCKPYYNNPCGNSHHGDIHFIW